MLFVFLFDCKSITLVIVTHSLFSNYGIQDGRRAVKKD